MSLTKKDLSSIEKVMAKSIKPLEKRLTSIEERIDKVEKDTLKINSRINIIIDFFDNEYLALKAKVKRIEDLLKITPLSS